MTLSVVVPAYNEERRILPSLRSIFAHLDKHHPEGEVIVVDDGSEDRMVARIQEEFGDRVGLRVLTVRPNRGKGFAVRRGILEATGDAVLVSDADLSTPIEEVERMLPLLDQGYDLVIGSRAHRNSDIQRHQNWLREAAGKFFNRCVRFVVGLPFHDTQCGFKLLRRDTMRPVIEALTIDRFAYDVEMIAVALAMGRRATDVPVTWINSPASTVTLWRGLEAYLELWRVRRHARRLQRQSSGRTA